MDDLADRYADRGDIDGGAHRGFGLLPMPSSRFCRPCRNGAPYAPFSANESPGGLSKATTFAPG